MIRSYRLKSSALLGFDMKVSSDATTPELEAMHCIKSEKLN